MSLDVQTRPMPADIQARAIALISDETLRSVVADRASEYEAWAFHEGDLHIAGGFDATPCPLLIVTGDMTVDGLFEDADDPETIVCVAGTLRARNLVTAGWLDVGGDLIVAECVIGDYNDCSANIQGTLRARFFFPEEHSFAVGGFEVECAVGNHHRLGIDAAADRFLSSAYGIVPAANIAAVSAVLDAKYTLIEGDELYLFEGGADHSALVEALRAGDNPLLPRQDVS